MISLNKSKKYILFLCFTIVFSVIFFWFALIIQKSYTLLSFCNAFYFLALIHAFVYLIINAYNRQIISPILYVLRTVLLLLIGKRLENDYFYFREYIDKHQIKKIYILTLVISMISSLTLAVFLHILYKFLWNSEITMYSCICRKKQVKPLFIYRLAINTQLFCCKLFCLLRMNLNNNKLVFLNF